MIHELAEWEGYSDQVEATEEILAESLFGEVSVSKVLIAYMDNLPVGYLVYCPKIATYTGRNEIYLQDLYLRKEARGSGLGLAIVKRIVDGHGGNVSLINRSEGGLTAKVELPLE